MKYRYISVVDKVNKILADKFYRVHVSFFVDSNVKHGQRVLLNHGEHIGISYITGDYEFHMDHHDALEVDRQALRFIYRRLERMEGTLRKFQDDFYSLSRVIECTSVPGIPAYIRVIRNALDVVQQEVIANLNEIDERTK